MKRVLFFTCAVVMLLSFTVAAFCFDSGGITFDEVKSYYDTQENKEGIFCYLGDSQEQGNVNSLYYAVFIKDKDGINSYEYPIFFNSQLVLVEDDALIKTLMTSVMVQSWYNNYGYISMLATMAHDRETVKNWNDALDGRTLVDLANKAGEIASAALGTIAANTLTGTPSAGLIKAIASAGEEALSFMEDVDSLSKAYRLLLIRDCITEMNECVRVMDELNSSGEIYTSSGALKAKSCYCTLYRSAAMLKVLKDKFVEDTPTLESYMKSIFSKSIGTFTKSITESGWLSETLNGAGKAESFINGAAKMYDILNNSKKAIELFTVPSNLIQSSIELNNAYTAYNNDYGQIFESAAFASVLTKNTVVSRLRPDRLSSSSIPKTKYDSSVSDGVYTVQNVSAGLMLNVYAGANNDGTNVVTWAGDGTNDQRFCIKHCGNGKYVLLASCSKTSQGEYTRALDISTGSTAVLPSDGCNVDIWSREASWNNCQQFYLVPLDDGTYIIEVCSVPNLVLTADKPTANNGNVSVRKYTGSKAQKWRLSTASEVAKPTDTYENTYENTGNFAADLIGVARTQIGYKEVSALTGQLLKGDNAGEWYSKYGDRYNNPAGPWCAFFVMWCAEQANVPSTVIPQAQSYGNCGTLMDWFKNRNAWKDKSYSPSKGDIIFFDTDSDNLPNHVGIVTGTDGNGGVYTVEGNVQADLNGVPAKPGYYQVVSLTRTNEILGYGTPAYSTGDVSNAVAVSGTDAYMKPDASSPKVWYTEKNDKCIVLCEEKDFYLLMYPFNFSGRYITAYVPKSTITLYGAVPSAEDYYKLNKTLTATEEIVLYHDPSTFTLRGATSDVTVRARLAAGSEIKVLFEYSEFYFVESGEYSGFVPVSCLDISSAVSEEEPKATIDPSTVIAGDVDGDGVLTENDGKMILNYCVNALSLNADEKLRADADGNGTVNAADAARVFVLIKNKGGN